MVNEVRPLVRGILDDLGSLRKKGMARAVLIFALRYSPHEVDALRILKGVTSDYALLRDGTNLDLGTFGDFGVLERQIGGNRGDLSGLRIRAESKLLRFHKNSQGPIFGKPLERVKINYERRSSKLPKDPDPCQENALRALEDAYNFEGL